MDEKKRDQGPGQVDTSGTHQPDPFASRPLLESMRDNEPATLSKGLTHEHPRSCEETA
jgi:hypothetical protein